MKRLFSISSLFFLLSINVWTQEEASFEILSKTTLSWDGSDLPDYSDGEAEITIIKVTIPPKAKLKMHKHPFINAGVLLKGELTVITEEKDTLNMKAGDPIIEVVDKWHFGLNEGDIPAEIIVFYAGIKGETLSIKKIIIKE